MTRANNIRELKKDHAHALVAGWFSFEDMGTTAGDIISKNIVCEWLREVGISYDVALAPSFMESSGVDWKAVDALAYSDLIFVCGPFGNGWPVTEMLASFKHCRLTGINLSLLQPLSQWNPFTHLLERDNFTTAYPDITFAGNNNKAPVVGIIRAHKQKEYGSNALHDKANQAIQRLIDSREMSIVNIDTVLADNPGGLRTPAEIESLIAAMDVVVTTRLHGSVLALKNGVPVVPIDPIAGGAKISLQVKALGWPLLFNAPLLDHETICNAFDFCLTGDAHRIAEECSQRARENIEARKQQFLKEIGYLVQDKVKGI